MARHIDLFENKTAAIGKYILSGGVVKLKNDNRILLVKNGVENVMLIQDTEDSTFINYQYTEIDGADIKINVGGIVEKYPDNASLWNFYVE